MATRSASAYQGLERAPDDLIKAIRTFGFLFSITLLQWYILINPPELGFSREVASIYMQMEIGRAHV